MSCINVTVWPVILYDISTDISVTNSLQVSVEGRSDNIYSEITSSSESVVVNVNASNTGIDVSVQSRGGRVSATLSIVCTISTGETVFLEVIEGRLITIEGEYIKVLR